MWMWPTPEPSALRQPPCGVVSFNCSVCRPQRRKVACSVGIAPVRCSSATQASVASLLLTVIIGSSSSGQPQCPASTARPTPTATTSFSSDAGYGATMRCGPVPCSGWKSRRDQSAPRAQAQELP